MSLTTLVADRSTQPDTTFPAWMPPDGIGVVWGTVGQHAAHSRTFYALQHAFEALGGEEYAHSLYQQVKGYPSFAPSRLPLILHALTGAAQAWGQALDWLAEYCRSPRLNASEGEQREAEALHALVQQTAAHAVGLSLLLTRLFVAFPQLVQSQEVRS